MMRKTVLALLLACTACARQAAPDPQIAVNRAGWAKQIQQADEAVEERAPRDRFADEYCRMAGANHPGAALPSAYGAMAEVRARGACLQFYEMTGKLPGLT